MFHSYRIAEHLATSGPGPMCGIRSAARFDATDDAQQLARREFGDRSAADPWKDVPPEQAEQSIAVTVSPTRGELREPLSSHDLETIG